MAHTFLLDQASNTNSWSFTSDLHKPDKYIRAQVNLGTRITEDVTRNRQERSPPGILKLIAGLIGLTTPLIVLTGSTMLAFASPVGTVVGLIGICAGLLILAGPVLHLIAAYGAFNLRKWAWWLGILATGIDVLGATANVWNGTGILQAIIPVGFSIIVFIYLLTPGVRKAFEI
jgi:hypothetical protein